MSLAQELLALESQLHRTLDRHVLSKFYEPIQRSLSEILNVLHTFTEKEDEDKEKDQKAVKLNDEVTKSIQTIYLWIEFAKDSIRRGILLIWVNSLAFEEENNKTMQQMKDICEIMTKVNNVELECFEKLNNVITPVEEKNIFMSFLTYVNGHSYKKDLDLLNDGVKLSDLIRIETDGRISQSNIDELSLCPWSYKELAEKLPDLYESQTMESNVYWFETTDGEQTQRCSAKHETGKALTFYIATKAAQQEDEKILKANILDEGKWKLHEAHCLGNYVIFKSENVEAFFILGTPKESEFVVGPSGGQYVHKTDNRVRLEFPEGSVKESNVFKITIIPVKVGEMKERKTKFPDQYKFLAVSKGLHVKGSALLKPIKIHLPLVHLEHFEEADTEYLFFHIDGDQATQLVPCQYEKEIDTIVTYVDKFSILVGAQIDRRSNRSISSLEARISLGLIYPCKLLTFIKKVSEEYVQVWCEVVKKEIWGEIETKRLREHPNIQKLKDSNSPDIFIPERQRLRIDVKGNSFLGHETPRNILLVTFYPLADGNHIFPPLRKKGGMHGIPYSIITYSLDSGKNTTPLHSVSFDPWTMPMTTPKQQSESKSETSHTCLTKEFGLFLKENNLTFVKELCLRNGIYSTEIFLMLTKEDLMDIIGLNLGQSLLCIKAQKKYAKHSGIGLQ